ncbi:importin subunit alpha-2 [Arachis ipaensis]|uniref:importin subunit alpha-2 n=1 Tax=Arachis ipaensis TaxID=130454 RepID=UPI000A2B3814|nr:importin subunit alpha-2 [Arachis ipaensis]
MSYRPTGNSRTDVRRSRYKVAVDAEEGRRRREDTMVEIRKNRREESLQKKRREGLQAQQIPASAQSTVLEKKVNSYYSSSPLDFDEILVAEPLVFGFQAVWALGNVAGDSPRCRDLVLSHGALLPLLAQLNEHAKLSMLRNATWTLSNFCRGKPQPPFDQVKPALPALASLIHSNDEEVLTDACWALSYLSDGTNDKIQAVIEAGVCPRLVELLMHPSPSVLIPALRTVGNIVTGDDMQTQIIINHQALPCLLNLLSNTYKKSIKKEACWTISNITAGNKQQIQAVIESNIIGPLVSLLQNAEFDIKKEAAWAISNATSGGSHEQIKYLVSQGCIKPLCDLLICPDPRIVTVCLEGLENILKVGEADKNMGNTGDVNLYAQMIDDAEGLEKIENLQSHDNTEIYEKAVKILETYWLEEDDETMPPGDGSQSGFNFGGSDGPAVPPGGFNF